MTDRALIAELHDHADRMNAGPDPAPTAVDGLSVMRRRRPAPVEPVVYEPVLCVVLEGAKEVWHGEVPVHFVPGQSSVISFHMPTRARILEAPYLSLGLRIDPKLLHEIAAEIDLPEGGAAGVVSLGEADGAVMDALARMFRLGATPGAIPQLAPLIRRELHYWLLNSSHGPALRELARPASHAARIARATAEIRRNYDAPLRVGDLARGAAMSDTSFHARFKDLTGTTPLQFQKRLRLLEARRLIEAGGQGVSQAAFAVGYESPTQFSREFSRMFGRAPSQFKPEAAGT